MSLNRIAFAIASALVALSLSAAFYLARADEMTQQTCQMLERYGEPHPDCWKLKPEKENWILMWRFDTENVIHQIPGYNSFDDCESTRDQMPYDAHPHCVIGPGW